MEILACLYGKRQTVPRRIAENNTDIGRVEKSESHDLLVQDCLQQPLARMYSRSLLRVHSVYLEEHQGLRNIEVSTKDEAPLNQKKANQMDPNCLAVVSSVSNALICSRSVEDG